MTTRYGNRRPRLVASAAGRGPTVRAVVLVRLHVNAHRVAELPRHLRGSNPFPPGTLVRIDVGHARDYLDLWGELGTLVGCCAHVEIVGTEPEGVDAVLDAVTRALRAGASLAC